MAVNQTQVDHIISSASADDPEIKLLRLQDDVDLIKGSIKRLLIDIREQMNDLDNPIFLTPPISEGTYTPNNMPSETTAIPDIPAEPEIKEDAGEISTEISTGKVSETSPHMEMSLGTEIENSKKFHDNLELLSELQSQIGTLKSEGDADSNSKFRLQKTFRLFEWTTLTVKKYGHARIDIMLDSYRKLGYVSEKSCDLIQGIARLIPTELGELHEIRANEFVSELYELNMILDPVDSTMDRDMIKVLMEQRQESEATKQLDTLSLPELHTGINYTHSKYRI